jgi:hypothetical protein
MTCLLSSRGGSPTPPALVEGCANGALAGAGELAALAFPREGARGDGAVRDMDDDVRCTLDADEAPDSVRPIPPRALGGGRERSSKRMMRAMSCRASRFVPSSVRAFRENSDVRRNTWKACG